MVEAKVVEQMPEVHTPQELQSYIFGQVHQGLWVAIAHQYGLIRVHNEPVTRKLKRSPLFCTVQSLSPEETSIDIKYPADNSMSYFSTIIGNPQMRLHRVIREEPTDEEQRPRLTELDVESSFFKDGAEEFRYKIRKQSEEFGPNGQRRRKHYSQIYEGFRDAPFDEDQLAVVQEGIDNIREFTIYAHRVLAR